MEPADPRPDPHRNIPRFAKIIILTQATIILAFTVGMYQEYLNNAYFQKYVIVLFTSSIIADTILSLVTASVFALGTFTLLGSMSSRKTKEWKVLTETPDSQLDLPAIPVLETVTPLTGTTRKPRHRKRRANNDDIFRAMTRKSDPTDD